MSELPEGWTSTELGSIGDWCSGGTPSRRIANYFGQGIPCVKSGDLPDGLILNTEEQITELGLNNSSAKLMPTGAISIALYGATIGKLGVMTFPAATNQACANVVPNINLVEPRYLFFYLLSERKTLIEKGQGGAQPNISQEIVKSHPIALAPLNEQRRIVAKLEEIFEKLDVVERRLDRVQSLIGNVQARNKLDKLRQSVLARAFRGELVMPEAELACLEGREYEPASVLLERIRRERAQQQESAKSKPKRTPRSKKDTATKKMFA